MDINYLKELLKRYNLKPNFTYGQNFLIDESVLDEIVNASGVSQDDQVLEIGPGIGNLTEKLLRKAEFVLSVEKDKKFLPILRKLKKKNKNFEFQIEDILKFNFQKFFSGRSKKSYKVVANIPYFITGKILQTFLTAKHKPKSITVLTQKEVAKNIVAKAGALSIPAIAVQIFGSPKIVKMIKAGSFYPAPKVDSSILHIEVFQRPKYKIKNEEKFFRVVKACFLGKRKQIHNTLANNLKIEKNFVNKVLKDLKISPRVRPQELSIHQWIELVEKIKNY